MDTFIKKSLCKTLALVLIVFSAALIGTGSAQADPVSFYTQGSWDSDLFDDQITKTFEAGNNSFILTFDGSEVSANSGQPVSFGTFSFDDIERNGATASGEFYLRIYQIEPGPEESQTLLSQLSGRIGTGGGNSLFTVDFIGGTSATISGILYQLDFPSFQVMKDADGSYEDLDITGKIFLAGSGETAGALSLTEAPEPTSLLLLGTGIAVLGLAARRKLKK